MSPLTSDPHPDGPTLPGQGSQPALATEAPSPSAQGPVRKRHAWLRRIVFTVGALAVIAVIALAVTCAVLRRDLRANLLANEGLLDGRVAVAGLSAPVTVTRDQQNVPSIHASNLDDLLFAQGYITAADRLSQMDFLRRHAAGTLAEILGPSLVQSDRTQRFLELRAVADRAVAALPPAQLQQLQAYTRGINAYITTHNGSSGPNTLAIEFHVLHYTPALWQPRDTILVSLGMAEELSSDFPLKLLREAFSAYLPPGLIADLYPAGSWRDHPPAEEMPNPSTPSASSLSIPRGRSQSSVPGQDPLRLFTDLTGIRCNDCSPGSNNWVVAGSHTASGAPLLSNDMHVRLDAPDIWYEAALHVDGPTPLDVEGFTLPGIPFVLVGRNPYVAWGFTNSMADAQDLFIEHFREAGSITEYERPDRTWAPVTHHPEIIHVRGGRDVTLDVVTVGTKIGSATIQTPIVTPIIQPFLPSEHRPLALAWTVYDPSTIGASLLALDSATDAASLVAAVSNFSTASQNLVYADAHHIGYHLLGCIAIRGPAVKHPGSGRDYTIGSPLSPGPVDALDTSYAWSGYIPFNQLPSVQDPRSGIIATANARITPNGYPYAISLNWVDPYRVERIYHLLDAEIASGHPLTPADMLRMQTDVHSDFDLFVAQRLAYALDHSALTRANPRLSQATGILRNWNGDVSIDSAAAEIVTAAEPQLWDMLLTPQIAAYARALHRPAPSAQDLNKIRALYHSMEADTALEQILRNTPARWLPPSFSNWNDFLASAVERGLHSIGAPGNLSTLTYGPSHPIEIAHPIFGSHSLVSTLLGVATGTGNHPNSGDGTTVKAAGPHAGPSERFTADLSNPNDTLANITTGESGNPASHWFLDQFPIWLKGATLTLPLNNPSAAHTLTLIPQ